MKSLMVKQGIFSLSDRARNFIVNSIVFVCMFLFALSGIDKLLDHEKFATGLSKVTFIGNYAMLISWSVPIAELFVCALLAISKMKRLGLYLFTALMTVFTVYICWMLLWAEKLPCRCNLIVEKLSFGEHLVFNLVFIGLALIALRLSQIKLKH
jgi:uncharacterized membrane protein YphA (DoxX/SURF4 family)